jgi:hypothetical protein
MKTVTSVSGGQTSAYVAANYPSDYLLFSLVRIEDTKCKFPDEKLRQEVEDRIQKPFIATAEDDKIVKTIFDLEQYLGQKVNWVSGLTFDEVIKTKRGWLPNKLHRYCTTWLKIDPMFYWWAENIGEPVKMQIGFRANEQGRAKRTLEKCNDSGLLEYKATFGKHESGSHRGKNKWESVEWQKPEFPLIADGIYKDNIIEYWRDKPVRFAKINNCVHCFHKNPMLLKLQSIEHPEKMKWATDQEGGENGYWRSDVKYDDIINYNLQNELGFDDFSECDSGYCGL